MSLGCAAASLSACGGGGGGEPAGTSPNPSAPQTAAPTVSIDAFGDSTMKGFSATSKTTGIYTPFNAPADLQSDLQGIFGTGVTVTNDGVSATTLGELIAGTDGVHAPWAQQVEQSKAKIVIENHGINDALYGPGESPAAFKQLLVQWVTDAMNAGKTPVLEEPNPVCDALHPTLDQYVQAIDDVGTEMNVLVIKQYAYIQSLPDWQAYLADCIHPNPALYAIKAQREAAALYPLVAKLLE